MASSAGVKKASTGINPETWEEVENRLDPTIPHDPVRERIALMLKSAVVEGIIGLTIFISICLLIFETDLTADGQKAPSWLLACNLTFLIIYILELIIRLWVYRSLFLHDKANIIDALVVGFDLGLLIIRSTTDMNSQASFRVVRTFRLVRMVRSFRILRKFHELNLLIMSFEAAMKSIFWGMLILLLMTTSFSVLAVELIHPINYEIWKDDESCSRCHYAFATVWNSNLTIFQTVIAGDSWGQLALPLIDKEPSTALFFGFVVVSISMTMLNLVLAVIVDAAQEAKLADEHTKSLVQQEEMLKAKAQLLVICNGIDADGSGYLTITEFLQGFERDEELKDILRSMDISKDDLTCVFNVLDTDGSGDIHCLEFVDQLHRLKSQQSQQILFTVTEIKKLLVAAKVEKGDLEGTPEAKLDQASRGVHSSAQEMVAKVDDLFKQLQQDKADMLVELSKEMVRSMTNLQESLVSTLSPQLHMVTALHAQRPMQQLPQGQPKDLGDSKFCWGLSQGGAGTSPGSKNATLHNSRVSGLPPYRLPASAQAPVAQGT
eukprot:TRINITY_DN4160_c0_g1_i1.p1 TRINITY_DN4160_c0_g1~~TRINITY_DN4160_c0_g1_i1.p1  ORF type:complete len:567 (-),score=94.95 TRINITY_DN4160_c0_g1_i1:17-1663(-)